MKRILSIILAVLILCSVFVVPASALSSQFAKGKYAEQFEQYLRDMGYPWNGEPSNWYMYSELYEYYSEDNTSQIPDWVLVSGSTNMEMPAGHYAVYGDYYISVVSGSIPAEIPYYIYLPEKNQFYELDFAWVEKFDGIEKAFTEYLVPNGRANLVEDIDGDGVITAVDAEKIDMGIKVFNSHEKRMNVYFDIRNSAGEDFETIYYGVVDADRNFVHYPNMDPSRCSDFDGDGVYRCDMTHLDFIFDKASEYQIYFTNDKGDETAKLTFKNENVGDTVYFTGKTDENGNPIINWTKNASWKYEDKFEKYLNEHGTSLNEGFYYEELYEYYADGNTSSTPNFVLTRGGTNYPAPGTASGVFGEYYMYVGWYHMPYPLGYYVYIPEKDNFYTLEFVWMEKLEGIENVFTEYLIKEGIATYVEDVDSNGVITETDADAVTKGIDHFNSFETRPYIYFDTNGVGWDNFEKVYCGVTKNDGSPLYNPQSRGSLCTDFDGDGIWKYDLYNLSYMLKNTTPWSINFHNENGNFTAQLNMTEENVGDTVYCTGKSDENGNPAINWTADKPVVEKLTPIKKALADYEKETGKKLETNRYYFLKPNGENGRRGNDPQGKNYNEFAPSWNNEYTEDVGIWWWLGEFNTASWPGFAMERLNDSDVYYADVPKDAETVFFNNTIDAGFFDDSPLKELECHTDDVIAYGYEPGENELYPDGIESFDNMIFVLDPSYQSYEMTDRAKNACNGDWYYYYGDGCYGTVKGGNRLENCIREDHKHKLISATQALKAYEAQSGKKVVTNRYFFLMPNGTNGQQCNDESSPEMLGKYPKSWYNEYTDGAGIYWWDCAHYNAEFWPGYTMEKGDVSDVYYADVPRDVKNIVFNNTVDGGMDETSEIFKMAEQTYSVPCEYYDAGESENYPDGVASFNYMIFVVYPVQVSTGDLLSKGTWGGEWYYYYGDGCYGTVKGGSTADCIRDDHNHSVNFLYFDANTTDWEDYEKVYCHIWENGGDSFFNWQVRKELCTDEDNDGIFTYDLDKAEIKLEPDKKYYVIFSNEKQEQAYHLELRTTHIGNTAYLTDRVEADNDFEYKVPAWRSLQLHFDTNTTDWDNYKKVYCHIWEYGGDSFFNWQVRKEQCYDLDGDGIWTYDLEKAGIELEEGKQYGVIFSNANQLQTYDLLFDSTVLGDTAYADGKFDPYEDGMDVYRTYWRNQDKAEFGPIMRISSIGQVTGTCIPKGLTAEDLFKDFLENNLVNAQLYSGKTDQQIIDDLAKELHFTANEVEFILTELEIYYVDCAWRKSKSTLEKSNITSPDEKDIYQVVRDYKKESGDEFSTKRYYFMMPNVIYGHIPEDPIEDRPKDWTWYNKYADSAYIYWTDTGRLDLESNFADRYSCSEVGYMAMNGDDYDIYYADVPDFVTSITWTNGVKVTDINDPMFEYAHRTEHIMCEYYDVGESELYPDGLDSFENMIYVLDEDAKSMGNPVAEEKGEWYYYYGDSCYGTVKNGDKYDCLNPHHYHRPQDTYIVAGVEKLCGSSWDVYDTNNKMIFNEDTETFEITYKDVPVGNHEFMVTKNYQFGPLLPGNPDYNEAKVTVDGSTVKITYKVGVGVEVTVTPPLLGDVDLDGVISVMDATEIQLAIAKRKTLTDEQKQFADTDFDGEISIMDATAIQLYVAKKITEFK